jgi:organic hydroperoxide reductase OsmC/OhrA
MHPFPHRYTVTASAQSVGSVTVSAAQLPDIVTAPPIEFDGPGNLWSPESLLCAAIADCFILTFRAIARASKLEWSSLDCRVEGVLERVEGVSRFTSYSTHADLHIPVGVSLDTAKTLLEKAEHGCLVSNSMLGTRSLTTEISQH